MAEKVGRESPFKGVMEKLSSIEAMVEKVSGLKADIDIDTSDIDKANDELDKFNEKLAEAQKTLQRFNGTGQIRYFATQEKALAHLTKAWEEYKKASSEDDKKSAGRRLMTWAHAYQGAGYSTKDIDKEMFDAADRVYASFKTTGKKGESNSMRMYSKEAFEEIFEAARTAGVDPSESDKYWEKRYYQESKAIHRSAQKAAEQVKVEPVELDVAELFKIDESGLKARMDKLKKSVKKIRDKLIDENGERTDKSLGKNQGAQFLKDLFELDKYNKDTGQLALKGSTKAFKIVLEEMGLKNDLKGDLKPFMSEAQENYNKALEKARRAVKKAGITLKPSSTKETPSEGASTESKSQPQKPMTQFAEDSKAAGKAADDAAKSFQKAAGAAEEAGDKAANSAARTRESAEETRSAAEETAEAAEAANNAQRQMSENSGDNGATQNAREAAAALNEEKEATRGLNDERERGVNSGSNDNTAERSRENAAALDEEKKAQQEVNEERSKGDKTSGQDEKPLSYLDAMILKLEEEKEKLKELQDESDKTRKMLDAASDVKELKKAREIIHGVVKNNQTGETKRNAFGFEGNPTALGSLVRQKLSEGNMGRAAAYYGEYAQAGGTDKFSDLTGKDITAELAERYRQAAEAIGKNPDELRKALNEVNKKILTQREVVSKIEKEVKAAQKEAAAQRKEQAQQEQVTNTDWQNGLNEQEIEAVEAYIKRMKALQKEAYNETSALAQAMSLLEKIKKRDMSGLMDQFTRADSPSSAMLGKMTNMPVNNQKARNDALRSLNQEEYDRLASQQTEGITKGIGKAVEKAKSETELKWEEFADAFLGTDVFADKTKGLDKHNVMKQFEKYGNTAKEALEEINKQWLSGTLDKSKFSGTSDKFVKEYIDALDAAKEKADAARSANVGDPDVNSLFSSGGTTALTQEQVDALQAEAAAYDDLIAKKKEYYGIKTTDSPEQSSSAQEENSSQIKLRGTLEEVEQAYKELTAAKEAYDRAKATKESFAGVTEQSALIRERRRRSYDAYDSAVVRYQEAFDKYNGFFGSKQDAEEWGKQYDTTHVKEAAAQGEDAVARSQAAIRAEIDETNEIIKEQEAWFDRVKQVNDELTFTHKNKRQALKELKQTSAEYKELKENPDNFDEIETARRIFRYQNAGTHAEQLGLDPEVISQYWTKLPIDQFKEETRKFAEESARRNVVLYEAKEKMQELSIEYNKTEVASLSAELGTTIRKEQNKINREIKAYENGVLETQSHENQKLILEKYDNAPRKSSAEFLDFQSTEEYSKLDERGKSLVDGLIQAYQKLEMIKKDGGLEYLQMLKQEKELTEEIGDVREKLFNAQDSERNGDKVDANSLLSEKETIDSIIEKLKLLDSEKAKTYGIFGTSKHEAGTGDIQKQIDSLIQAKNDIDAILERVGQAAPSSSNASTFAADIKSLEGYSSANEDFVNQLIADVIAGQKEYDQAMNELKTHIAQRQEEIRAEEELRTKRVRNAGFGEDVKALENYGYADKDFVQNLTAQVLEGTKEYDDAMDELKAHIEQKHAEMMAVAEKSNRDNTEIGKYYESAKPIIESMGLNADEPPEEYYRFVDAIREEGIEAEEALRRFADTVGYVYDEVAGKWQKITEPESGGMSETEETANEVIDRNNQSLKERIEYLKQIKAESKFLETAEDRKSEMEEKEWDAGGSNPRATEAQSQSLIERYEAHVERMENANELIDNFEDTYEKVIITMKNGDEVVLQYASDLEEVSLAASKIKDIKFVPFADEIDEIDKFKSGIEPIIEAMNLPKSFVLPSLYGDFIEKIQSEAMSGEEAIREFAKTYGYVYDEINKTWSRPTSRRDDFFGTTIEGYKEYIDTVAGGPELNSIKIAWESALKEEDFQEVLDIVQKINEAFRQGKLDAEGYVEGVGYLDGMDWAKYYARYLTKDDKHGHGARYLDEVPEGWKKIEGALTAPKGYEWYSNGKSRFSGEYQQALVKIKEAADDVTESERQMGQAGEEAAVKVTKVTGDAFNKELKSFAAINSDILEEPKYEYDYDKLIERGGQLEQILTKVFDENPGATLQTVIDTVQQELTDAQGRAKELDDTLKQIREGSKKWSFNDMLNDPDAFADDLNKLTEQLIALREAGKGDTKEALNLETRIQHMLAAQGKVFDQPNKKAFMPYFEKVQSKLTDGAKSIQDEMWEAMANDGNLTSRNDFPSLVADRLGLGIEYNKDFLAGDIRELQSLLDILQHIDTVRGRISDQGKIDFFGKQVDRNLQIAKELEERLQGTSEEDRAYDPEWVENQYKYIAEHLQKAEELKKKIAELKGEVYEMQTFTAESVKAQLTQQQPEDPVENFKKTWTKAVLKSTEPPEALSQAYMQYIKDINSGAISAEDAMTGMEQVAKRLDVAFDEASQKWQKIQFSPEIQANLDAFNKAIPSFEDGVSVKTFDDTKKKYEDLVYAIKYESKSAEEAIQEMLAAIKEAAAANGDLYGQEPSKSETPNRKFLVSATTPHAAKATYIKRTIAEDTDTSVEDLGEDISDVGGRAAEAVGNLDSFTESAKNAAEAARKAAGIEGESRIISRSGVNGTNASATYELARGMHYTENWSYRNGNEETGEEPGWAMTSARYVINYQALLNDTITTMKQLAKAEADLALAQEQGRGENVTSQIQKQIGLYRTRIDQNAKLAEQYERMGDLEDELVLRDGYTKRQYDEDLKAQKELIDAQGNTRKEKFVDDERKRQATKQDREVARAQKYATERLVALKKLESDFTTEGSSRYLSVEGDRTAITDMAGKLRTKLEDIIKQNRAMTIDEMDDIIAKFGDIKVEGDTRYARSTAKKGDLSRQKVDSLKNVLSSDLDAFSQQAQRSSGDISHITEEVNKLKEALNGNVSSEFITESFQKLRELRAELKAINEEQRTKTSTEKARQAEIKLVAELQESYIKLAEAEEKRDHASTETGRELGRRQSDQIKKRQDELKKRVESTLGKDFANKAVAEAETEANKLRTAYANDRNEGISTKGLGFGENDDVERTWDTLIAKAQQYQKILYKQQSGGTITVNEAALLQKLSDLYQQAGEKAEEAGEKGQKFNEAVAAAQQAVRDSVISKYSETIGGLTAGNKNMPEAYNKQVEELKNNLEQLKNIDFDTTEWKEMVGNLDAGLNNLRTDASMRPVTDSQKAQLDRQMASWMNSNSGAGEFLGQVQRLRDALSNVRAEDEFNGIQSDFEKVRAAAADAGKTGESFGAGLKKRFKSLGQYLLSFASFYRVIGVFKQAFSTVKELDDALVEMRKVSDESLSSLQRYQSLSFNIADEVGTTARQIQQSTADWLRLGESFEEAQKSAKESTILLNVSEFDNIDKATEALVSASQAYKDLDKIDIIDKLNNIGNNFSISTDQLATGLQNSAAVLMTQGNDIDEALALLTAGNALPGNTVMYLLECI